MGTTEVLVLIIVFIEHVLRNLTENLKMMRTCETYIKQEDQNRRTKVESTGEGSENRLPFWSLAHLGHFFSGKSFV
jgi:hypothetical protein